MKGFLFTVASVFMIATGLIGVSTSVLSPVVGLIEVLVGLAALSVAIKEL